MTIITISRGSFSGGKMLADCLADGLGYRCIDRDAIVERAVAAYGGTQEELIDALERPPTLWDRFKHKKYIYLTLFQAALADEARGGKVVYHGNAGHLLLRGVGHVLRARIVAPIEYRLALIQERMKMSKEEGMAYIQKMDQNRARWTQYLYGVDWRDSSLYDLVLNLENMEVREACKIIFFVARQECFAETPGSLAALENLALAGKVKATLVMDPRTAHLEVEAEADAGSVMVSGRVNTAEEFQQIERVTSNIPGVKAINLDGVVVYRDV
jgi:cytidylate kinase